MGDKGEGEIMEMLFAGYTQKKIAADCGISVQTASKHWNHILEKMDVENEVELVHLLIRHRPGEC